MTLDLTIAIPVRNEAANLPACLRAIGSGFARRVVVIDSSSSDTTPQIAREHGADVLNFEWNGQFPKKRNWFLRNHPPDTQWILFLDADEILTPAFKDEVAAKLQNPGESVGFWLSYNIYFLGHPLKGGYPLRKLALFRSSSGEYEHIEETRWSHLDMEIHEHPVLRGQIGLIRSRIDHRDLRGLEHWAIKHAAYADWEARRYLARSAKGKPADWTLPQKIKYRLMDTPPAPGMLFLRLLLPHAGLSGRSPRLGLGHSQSRVFAQVYGRIQELKTEQKPANGRS